MGEVKARFNDKFISKVSIEWLFFYLEKILLIFVVKTSNYLKKCLLFFIIANFSTTEQLGRDNVRDKQPGDAQLVQLPAFRLVRWQPGRRIAPLTALPPDIPAAERRSHRSGVSQQDAGSLV